jgi:hypothetical protein
MNLKSVFSLFWQHLGDLRKSWSYWSRTVKISLLPRHELPTKYFLSLPTAFLRAEVFNVGFSQTLRCRIFQNVVFSFNLFVLFFQTATKLLGQILIKLFWLKYSIDGSWGYLYWPWGTVKKLLRHYGRREPMEFGSRCVTFYRLDERLCGSQSLRRRSSYQKTPTHAWNQILTLGTCNPWAIFLVYEVIYSHSM